MPTTARGFRYPGSSNAPNVPQDIQNVAADVDFAFGNRLWVTHYRGNQTYSHTLGTSFADIPGLALPITVPAYRQLDVEVTLPSIELGAGGLVAVRLIINSVEVDAANVRSSGVAAGPVQLTGDLAVTASTPVNVTVQGFKTGTGTFSISASSVSGPRLRYRLL